ncbi:MAG: hypothetical protein HQL52_17845 [Magnetococcales bacterium]|nr:hypothetical protein [Magnetococcales bacterium]
MNGILKSFLESTIISSVVVLVAMALLLLPETIMLLGGSLSRLFSGF